MRQNTKMTEQEKAILKNPDTIQSMYFANITNRGFMVMTPEHTTIVDYPSGEFLTEMVYLFVKNNLRCFVLEFPNNEHGTEWRKL